MRYSALFAVMGVCTLTSSTIAGFSFRHEAVPYQIDSTQYTRVTFYAINDGITTGRNLQAMDVTVHSTKPMKFEFEDYDGDDRLDVAMTANANSLRSGALQGTKLIRTLFENTPLVNGMPQPANISTAIYDAVAAYTNLKSFRTVGFAFGATAGVYAGNDVGGAPFLTVITRPEVEIVLTGRIGGEIGGSGGLDSLVSTGALIAGRDTGLLPFAYSVVIPEPVSLGCLALFPTFCRRRRA